MTMYQLMAGSFNSMGINDNPIISEDGEIIYGG